MRSISVVLILAVIVVGTEPPDHAGKVYYDLKDAPALFEKFIKDFDRHYKDAAEKQKRYQNFLVNLVEINRLIKEDSYATFRITQFADLSYEEMPYYLNHQKQEV